MQLRPSEEVRDELDRLHERFEIDGRGVHAIIVDGIDVIFEVLTEEQVRELPVPERIGPYGVKVIATPIRHFS